MEKGELVMKLEEQKNWEVGGVPGTWKEVERNRDLKSWELQGSGRHDQISNGEMTENCF